MGVQAFFVTYEISSEMDPWATQEVLYVKNSHLIGKIISDSHG